MIIFFSCQIFLSFVIKFRSIPQSFLPNISYLCFVLLFVERKKNVTNIDEEKRRQSKIVKRQGEKKIEQSQGEYQSTP